MIIALYSLVSVVVVSLVSLIGVITLSLKTNLLRDILLLLVSMAVGAFLGDIFFHILPGAYEMFPNSIVPALLVMGGLFLFFAMEKFLRWRHCHIPTSSSHTHPVVTMNLVGDGVHNFVDGIIIGASYMASIPIGVATTVAVLLHEIPQEIGDFGVLIHGGLSVKKALVFNLFSAMTAILGTALVLIIGPGIQGFSNYILPIIGGAFLYIAAADLIPSLHDNTCKTHIRHAILQLFMIGVGVGAMFLLTFIE